MNSQTETGIIDIKVCPGIDRYNTATHAVRVYHIHIIIGRYTVHTTHIG